MFTGIVQHIGAVSRSHIVGRDLALTVRVDGLDHETLRAGDSVAVDGVCLTLVEAGPDGLRFDVSAQTLECTLLGRKVAGDRVNIEQALLPDTRLGGHFVTGHVDGVGTLTRVEPVGQSIRLRIRVPDTLIRLVARKGSISVDGVSLTVNEVFQDQFEVNVVPHTARATTMGGYAEGQPVHIEIDLIARYVQRLMAGDAPPPAPDEQITREFLADQGFNPPNLEDQEP